MMRQYRFPSLALKNRVIYVLYFDMFLFQSTDLYVDVQHQGFDFEATYDTAWRKEIWSEMDKPRFSKK